MAEFLSDIGGLLDVLVLALGLVILHRAQKEPDALLLKVAAVVLLGGGIAVGVCLGYYWLQYEAAGEFDHARGPTRTGGVQTLQGEGRVGPGRRPWGAPSREQGAISRQLTAGAEKKGVNTPIGEWWGPWGGMGSRSTPPALSLRELESLHADWNGPRMTIASASRYQSATPTPPVSWVVPRAAARRRPPAMLPA